MYIQVIVDCSKPGTYLNSQGIASRSIPRQRSPAAKTGLSAVLKWQRLIQWFQNFKARL
jgi:hypothetical protein